MKTEDLQALELSEEQIKQIFAMNGRDIAAEQKARQKAEADRDEWKKRAEAAETTLKGFDGVDVEKLKGDIEEWRKKAEEAQKGYERDLAERDFADALKAELDGIQFSSEAAKKAIAEEIKAAGLKLKDGKIYGLKEVIEDIKKRDASAFVAEGTAKFTTPPKSEPGKTVKGFAELPLAEKMKYANEHPTDEAVRTWLNG